jgi:hypothetical protein
MRRTRCDDHHVSLAVRLTNWIGLDRAVVKGPRLAATHSSNLTRILPGATYQRQDCVYLFSSIKTTRLHKAVSAKLLYRLQGAYEAFGAHRRKDNIRSMCNWRINIICSGVSV